VRIAAVCMLASAVLPSLRRAYGAISTITPEENAVKFSVKALLAIEGDFDNLDAIGTKHDKDDDLNQLAEARYLKNSYGCSIQFLPKSCRS
jgi:hypothetical protein